MTADLGPRPGASWLLGLALLAGCDGPPPAIQARASLAGHSREISSIAFAPDGRTLASRAADAVKLWDTAGYNEVAGFPGQGPDMGSVAFSPDGATVAVNSPGQGVVAWDLASKEVRATYLHPPRAGGSSSDPSAYGWGLAYSPDGRTLAGGGGSGAQGGFVTLWDTATGSGSDLEMAGGPVTSVVISSDGKTLASKGLGESIVLRDLATKAERRSIRVGRSFGAPVVFSPDGRTLASAGEDRRVRIWDVATGAQVASLKGHLKAVLSASYHPGGKLLASGDSGGTILLWDIPTRAAIARFEGHQGKVWTLAFSPDGKTLASAGQDKAVRLWDVGDRAGDPE